MYIVHGVLEGQVSVSSSLFIQVVVQLGSSAG